MDIKQLKELRAKSHTLEPILQIGKDGLTDGVVKEVQVQLKKRKLVKVKLLPAAGERERLTRELVEKTQAELVRQVGRIVVLYKK